jgi:hypothetical protein
MRSKIICSAFAAAILLTPIQNATAQGTSGGTGAVASIPGSVVRGAAEGRAVSQPGLISILTNPPPPDPYEDTRQTTRRGQSQMPSK